MAHFTPTSTLWELNPRDMKFQRVSEGDIGLKQTIIEQMRSMCLNSVTSPLAKDQVRALWLLRAFRFKRFSVAFRIVAPKDMDLDEKQEWAQKLADALGQKDAKPMGENDTSMLLVFDHTSIGRDSNALESSLGALLSKIEGTEIAGVQAMVVKGGVA